jgi:tetratricopeptide (TPR) repeat protein
MGDYFRQTGKFLDASTYSERAYAIADELHNVPLKLAASQYLGLTYHALGDSARAAQLLRVVVETPQDDAVTGEWRTQAGTRAGFLAVNLAWLARSLADTGHFDEALAYGRQGLELAEGLGTPYSMAATTFALGSVHGMRGELAAAIPLLERSRATTRDWNITLYECHALRALGSAYVRAGRVDEGLTLLRDSAAAVEARSLAVQHARVMAVLGEASLLAGRLDEAAAAATRALSLARTRGQLGDEATALAVLGQIALATTPPDRDAAEDHYRAALARGVELGMRPLQARCHLGLGHLYLEAGQTTQAEEHLTAGATLCCEMNMPLLLGQALIGLGCLGSTLLIGRERRDIYDHLSQVMPAAHGLRVVLDRRVQDLPISAADRRAKSAAESVARPRDMWIAPGEPTAPGSPGT